jgi:hypothetical protein
MRQIHARHLAQKRLSSIQKNGAMPRTDMAATGFSNQPVPVHHDWYRFNCEILFSVYTWFRFNEESLLRARAQRELHTRGYRRAAAALRLQAAVLVRPAVSQRRWHRHASRICRGCTQVA